MVCLKYLGLSASRPRYLRHDRLRLLPNLAGSPQQTSEAGRGLSDLGAGLAVAVPVAVMLLVLAVLHNRLARVRVPTTLWLGSPATVLLCGPLAAPTSLATSVAAIALVTVAVRAVKLVARTRPGARPVGPPAGKAGSPLPETVRCTVFRCPTRMNMLLSQPRLPCPAEGALSAPAVAASARAVADGPARSPVGHGVAASSAPQSP